MATRTRSRTGTFIPSAITGARYYNNVVNIPSGFVLGQNSAMSQFSGMEVSSMTDVVKNKGGNNNVTHKRCTFNTPAVPLTYKYIPAVGWGYDVKGSIGAGGILQTLSTVNPHAAVSSLDSLAIARLPKYAPQALMGAVSLSEIGQQLQICSNHLVRATASLAFGTWYHGGRNHKTAKQLRDLKKAWAEFIDDEIRPNLDNPRNLFKYLAGKDLEWKFGWKPFLADIRATIGAIDALDELIIRLTKGTTVYGKAQGTGTSSATASNYGDTYTTLGVARGSYKQETVATTTASLKRKLLISKLPNRFDLKILMLKESLGLKIGLNEIWEKIPYSFVIDWVFPLCDAIESMAGQQVDASWFTDSDHCLSTKLVTTSKATAWYDGQPSVVAGATMSSVSFTRTYGAFAPQTPYVPDFRLPNLNQWFTGLELALQRTFAYAVRGSSRG